MSTSHIRHLLITALVLASPAAFAAGDDGAFFDPPYPAGVHVRDADEAIARDEAEPRSNIREMMRYMSPVKSQGHRGTCSIFSSTAMLESMLIRAGAVQSAPDIAEEWLEYVVTRYASENGSYAPKNFQSFVDTGFVTEKDAPYVSDDWTSVSSSTLAQERCGDLSGSRLTSCLMGHWDPKLLTASTQEVTQEFSDLRRKSDRMAERYLRGKVDSGFRVDSVKTARALLRAGIPVVLEVPVYYGAWNHRIADDLGIGRDMEAWANGEVGYPEPGSMDYEHSNDEAAGHSILIVGYDDDREVTTHVKMADGSVQTFHYRGAYIMKNSWGTEAFGRTFQADGEAYPGYGLITYKYAHEYGSFYRFPLRVSQTDN